MAGPRSVPTGSVRRAPGSYSPSSTFLFATRSPPPLPLLASCLPFSSDVRAVLYPGFVVRADKRHVVVEASVKKPMALRSTVKDSFLDDDDDDRHRNGVRLMKCERRRIYGGSATFNRPHESPRVHVLSSHLYSLFLSFSLSRSFCLPLRGSARINTRRTMAPGPWQ